MLPAQRALISVYDKRGVVELATGLARLGIEILSTGGTAAALAEAGLKILRVSEVTGSPEMLDGRVKTLHPRIHGGILADRARAGHLTELTEHGITPIDLVVSNLYPFRERATSGDATFEELVDLIDIGGSTMVRAAAKNHQGVVVVVDPDDYTQVLAALEELDRTVPEKLRRRLAIKAFRHTEAYDAAISEWLEQQSGDRDQLFPEHMLLDLRKVAVPRYGENPHQQAAIYLTLGGAGVLGGYEQLRGKQLSYNNLLDADSARRLVASFDDTVVAVIKHNNPCGVGRGSNPAEAWERALACDPLSAFGSVVAVNRPVDAELAQGLTAQFIEVVTAPSFEPQAIEILERKKNLRLLAGPGAGVATGEIDLRALDGGFLAQTRDDQPDDPGSWTCATERQPTPEERSALEFVWNVARHVRSNAIVVGNAEQTVGIGAGQMSRIDSCRLAVTDRRLEVRGTVAASDAFFPFRDGLDVLAEAGVTAVIQPGGSKRDAKVIAAADEQGMAMLLTGTRHFRH